MNIRLGSIGSSIGFGLLALASPAGAQLAGLLKPPLEILHEFAAAKYSGPLDGIYPLTGLIRAGDGRFYGTTDEGGKYGYDPITNSFGNGTVFSIDSQGNYTQLYSFTHVDNNGLFTNGDGREPDHGLIEGADGALYGTTRNSGPNGTGTVFRLTRDGQAFTLLHAFDALPEVKGGASPDSGLAQAPDGTLFGGTQDGGAGSPALGVLYRLAPDGSGYAVLRSYSNDGYGAFPGATPLIRSDGHIYAFTNDNPGTLFRVDPDGSNYLVLHQFGASCRFYHSGFYASLVEWTDGYLYGACLDGGDHDGGALFRIAPDGSGFQILHSFAAYTNGSGPGAALKPGGDGTYPESTLRPGPDGYFYGTTSAGGAHHNGTIYRLKPDGSGYRLLYSFPAFFPGLPTSTRSLYGAFPEGDIAFGDDGKLYGTAIEGGRNGNGVIWRFTPPP